MGELQVGRSIRHAPLVHLSTYADKSVSSVSAHARSYNFKSPASDGGTKLEGVMTSPRVGSRDASSITDRGVPVASAKYMHCLLRHVVVQSWYLTES